MTESSELVNPNSRVRKNNSLALFSTVCFQTCKTERNNVIHLLQSHCFSYTLFYVWMTTLTFLFSSCLFILFARLQNHSHQQHHTEFFHPSIPMQWHCIKLHSKFDYLAALSWLEKFNQNQDNAGNYTKNLVGSSFPTLSHVSNRLLSTAGCSFSESISGKHKMSILKLSPILFPFLNPHQSRRSLQVSQNNSLHEVSTRCKTLVIYRP